MTQRFCTACGVKLLSEAHFCAECGHPGAAAAPSRRFPLEQFAPALVLGTVLAVTGTTVLIGTQAANPPNVPPPRGTAGNPPGLPQNHPPIAVPDDVRQTIARLAETAKSKPDDLRAWQQLGFAQYRAGMIEPAYLAAAADTYTHIIEREPDNLEALRTLGNIAYDRDDPERAIEHYRRYLQLKPDDLDVKTDFGTMQLATRQTEAALQTYQAILAVDPQFFQAQFNLAIAYRAAGDHAKALAAMERARDVATDDATRQRTADLLARMKGDTAPVAPGPQEQAAAPPGPAAPAATARDLHGDVEGIFRSHPIVGSRLERIEWPEARHARVLVREFPMDGMPPDVRSRFVDRLREGVREKKARHPDGGPLTIELVDSGSGRVMETLSE